MSEELKEAKQEQTSNEDVTKVFGNKEEPAKETVDSKTEEEQETANPEQKSAASDSKEKKQSDKSYTQAEVDAMMAKARKKYSKGDETQTEDSITGETTGNDDVKEQQIDPTATQDLATGITVDRLAQAELKAEMAINGVDPSKVARAVRLIDVNEVLENGQYSEVKAKEAIEQLMKEWPELKLNKTESNDNQFYFGAPEQEEQQDKQKNMFSSIFGND